MSTKALLVPQALELPTEVDWLELVDEIQRRGNLRTLKAAARVADVSPIVLYAIHETAYEDPRYVNGARLINAYSRYLPGQPIPVRKSG